MTTTHLAGVITRGVRHRLLEGLRDIDDRVFEGTRRTRILFVFPDPYGFACQAPVILRLQAHTDVDVRVHWDRPSESAEGVFASNRDEELYQALRVERFWASLSKWHIVVYSHMCSFYPRRRALRAYLHHGAGFGSGGGLAAAEAFEIYLGLSEAERMYLESRNPGLFGQVRAFFSVGFPKSDALLDGTLTRTEVLSRLNLPDRRTILIASHYRPNGILRSLGPIVFKQILESFPDCNVIQTGHPWLWQQRGEVDSTWQRSLLTELQSIAATFEHARLVTNMLAEPLAAASDLLIADDTSVVTTFGLLDRPIAMFANAVGGRGSETTYALYRDASHLFGQLSELIPACKAALNEPQTMAKGRRVLRESFYANAGRSAEVTAEVLRRIGPVCGVRSPHWRRVLALSDSALG